MAPENDDREDEPAGLEHWLRPFVEESTLWPVTLVAGLVLATFGAGLVLMALLERNPFAVVGLLVAVWASAEPLFADWRRRRFGLVAGLVLTLWLAVAGIAATVVALGLF